MNQAKNFPRPSAIPKAFGLEAAAHQSAEPQFLHFLAHPLDQKDAGGVVAGRMLWLPNALLDLPLRKEWGSADSQAIARPESTHGLTGGAPGGIMTFFVYAGRAPCWGWCDTRQPPPPGMERRISCG
jgi:hypothetical protein